MVQMENQFIVMRINEKVFIISLVTSLIFVIPVGLTSEKVSAVRCEDIAGVEKWNGNDHNDNNPSESEFKDHLDEMTFCEFTEDIDKMEKEGAIREDTKHDWEYFEDTMVYQSAGEETQECLKDKYDLPDDGKKNLEAYEFLDCTY